MYFSKVKLSQSYAKELIPIPIGGWQKKNIRTVFSCCNVFRTMLVLRSGLQEADSCCCQKSASYSLLFPKHGTKFNTIRV